MNLWWASVQQQDASESGYAVQTILESDSKVFSSIKKIWRIGSNLCAGLHSETCILLRRFPDSLVSILCSTVTTVLKYAKCVIQFRDVHLRQCVCKLFRLVCVDHRVNRYSGTGSGWWGWQTYHSYELLGRHVLKLGDLGMTKWWQIVHNNWPCVKVFGGSGQMIIDNVKVSLYLYFSQGEFYRWCWAYEKRFWQRQDTGHRYWNVISCQTRFRVWRHGYGGVVKIL